MSTPMSFSLFGAGLLWVAGGALMVLIAFGILALAPSDRRHRSLVYMLIISGLWDVATGFAISAQHQSTSAAFSSTGFYANTLFAAATLGFAMAFVRSKPSAAGRWTIRVVWVVGIGLAAMGVVLGLPAAFRAPQVMQAVPMGFYVANQLYAFALGTISTLVIAWAILKRGPGPWARGTSLVLFGLLSYMWTAVGFIASDPAAYFQVAPFDPQSIPTSVATTLWAASAIALPVGVAVALGATAWLWSHGGADRRLAMLHLLVAALLVASTWVLSWDGLAPLTFVAFVSYALLRHRFLDIDIRIKWTLKQSTVAAIFIAAFFVVSELAAALFSDQLGTYAGIIAAGALVFAIVPLQQFGQRVADKAMPGVKGVEEMDQNDRLDLYREQLRIAWADGVITPDERRMLNGTRLRLGIPAEAAMAMEEQAAPGPKALGVAD